MSMCVYFAVFSGTVIIFYQEGFTHANGDSLIPKSSVRLQYWY